MKPGILSSTFHFPEMMLNLIRQRKRLPVMRSRPFRNAAVVVLAGLVALGMGLPSITVYFSGSVHFKNKKTDVTGLYLFVKADGQMVADTHVDEAGRYALSFVDGNRSSVDFYYAGLGHDTTFIRSFTRVESEVMTWDIEL